MSFIETGITSTDQENFHSSLKLVLREQNIPNNIVCDSNGDEDICGFNKEITCHSNDTNLVIEECADDEDKNSNDEEDYDE